MIFADRVFFIKHPQKHRKHSASSHSRPPQPLSLQQAATPTPMMHTNTI
jgi:hypothetical protein